MPRMIGSINCYLASTATLGDRTIHHDGTTVGLVRSAIDAGAIVGDTVVTDMGSSYRIISAPHDDRAYGYWADRIWNRKG